MESSGRNEEHGCATGGLATAADKFIVMIAVDGSKQSEKAFECKFTYNYKVSD